MFTLRDSHISVVHSTYKRNSLWDEVDKFAFVACALEVFLAELLLNWSHQLLGLSRLKLRPSVKHRKLGGCPRTVPPDEGGDVIGRIRKRYTQHRVLRDAEKTRRLLHDENEQESQISAYPNSSSDSSNPIKSVQKPKAQLYRYTAAFARYSATCLMQRSSPEGTLVHGSDVP